MDYRRVGARDCRHRCSLWPSGVLRHRRRTLPKGMDILIERMGRRCWVAVPTIIFLQRQISDANRHQRENIEISLMPKFALVIRVRHLVGFEQTSLILELRRYAKRGDNIGRYPMDRQGLGEICRQIKALLAEHDLIEFNATIAGEPKLTRYWIDRKTDDLYQNVVECDRDARDPSGLGQHKLNHHGTTIHVALVMLLDCVERYLLDRDEQARAFLVRWNQPAAEPWKSW